MNESSSNKYVNVMSVMIFYMNYCIYIMDKNERLDVNYSIILLYNLTIEEVDLIWNIRTYAFIRHCPKYVMKNVI